MPKIAPVIYRSNRSKITKPKLPDNEIIKDIKNTAIKVHSSYWLIISYMVIVFSI